jgi:predicted outer membrane protein
MAPAKQPGVPGVPPEPRSPFWLPLPPAFDSSHQGKLDKLKRLNGDDFTKQYESDQTSAHKDAVNLFDRYSTGSGL